MVRRLAIGFVLLLVVADVLLAAILLSAQALCGGLALHRDDVQQFAVNPAADLPVVRFGQLLPLRPFAVLVSHASSVRLSQGARHANLEAKSRAKGRVSR